MNRRQKNKAARLFAIALIAHCEEVADDDEANEIRGIAIEAAGKKLRQMGYSPGELQSEADCIKAATT